MELTLTSLAIAFASEQDVKQALQSQDPIDGVIEWEGVGFTFIRSTKALTIVRSGAMGGDVRVVHGGWRYLTRDDMLKEWNEIRQVAEAYKRGIRQ